MEIKYSSARMYQKSTAKPVDRIFFAAACLMLCIYLGIFAYLNMAKYTQHVDSDIAAEALLSREIWEEKNLMPNNWIASTEQRIVAVPALASLFYGMSGSMVFSMGISCVIVGGLLLISIACTFRRCGISRLGIVTALLTLCALPINCLRNDDQMVPFMMLLLFLFAEYYALHSICLFLCISFYLYLRDDGPEKKANPATRRQKIRTGLVWIALICLCGGLALSGMRCLQVIAVPLLVWEVLTLFFESNHMQKPLPSRKRWLGSGFILSLFAAAALAMLYPAHKDYTLNIETADLMVYRLMRHVPAAILDCLGIAGNCDLTSWSAVMQFGILAVIALTIYGLFLIFRRGKTSDENRFPKINATFPQKALIQVLGTSFLLTVFIEVVTNAEMAPNYFFVAWFIISAVFAVLITHFEKSAPCFAKLIVACTCIFALCNLFYTYRDCVTTEDNLYEYQEVIAFMDSNEIDHGYAEFWDASRISIMTDGRITMGHCYQMKSLRPYLWLTSTKWYLPNLPEQMRTAYVVCAEDKEDFEAQFEDASIVTCGFENGRFAVYTSDYNLFSAIQ